MRLPPHSTAVKPSRAGAVSVCAGMSIFSSSGFQLPASYYPIAPAQIWCYTRQLSQTDIFQSASYGENETRFFVFNYYPKVEVYDMILYKNQWYRITRVDTADDYKGDLFIYIQNAVGGWIPSDDEIEDYTPGKWDE